MPITTALIAVPIDLRLIAAIGGGYAVAAGLSALLAVGLSAMEFMLRSLGPACVPSTADSTAPPERSGRKGSCAAPRC